MIAVAMGESDVVDRIGSQFLDFHNHLLGCLFGHFGVDGQALIDVIQWAIGSR